MASLAASWSQSSVGSCIKASMAAKITWGWDLRLPSTATSTSLRTSFELTNTVTGAVWRRLPYKGVSRNKYHIEGNFFHARLFLIRIHPDTDSSIIKDIFLNLFLDPYFSPVFWTRIAFNMDPDQGLNSFFLNFRIRIQGAKPNWIHTDPETDHFKVTKRWIFPWKIYLLVKVKKT